MPVFLMITAVLAAVCVLIALYVSWRVFFIIIERLGGPDK